MNRRRFLAGSAAAFSMLAGDLRMRAAQSQADQPFDANVARRLAQELARKPYQQPDTSLPDEFKNIDYDAYRSIRFRPEQAIWRSEKLPFQLQFFHRGWIFKDRVNIYVVKNGRAQPVDYSPDLFDFGKAKPPPSDADFGFAGFRIHAKINRPDYYDEVGAFLGASYFRAVAKGQAYGMSARGLSVRTADPKGEEFPAFTNFWIEQPAADTNSLVVHALLDSPSAAAAFRFTIRPGETTIYDTELVVYPRADLAQAGIATGTSMFLFDANDRVGVDDFRPAVHDSDGLAMRSGRDEEIWRPLSNPRELQLSYFNDINPRGFGLMQRERDFFAYDDLESHFEKRPSLWAEPIGDWGEGQVQLVEIPTKEEIHDNIVAFWRPKDPLKAQGEYFFTYRLHWGEAQPNPKRLARFAKTNIGAGSNGTRRFVLEAVGGPLWSDQNEVTPNLSVSKGEIHNLVLQPNPQTGGMRVGFELDTKGEALVELRAQLKNADNPISETWLYRWTR
ncbi:MAG: glucan biosynthesis protein [Hyphomicrobiales bacterium]